MKVSNKFKAQFYNAGVMLNGKVYSSKVEKDCNEIYPLKNIIQRDKVDDKFFLSKETLEKLKKDKVNLERTENEAKFPVAPITLPNPGPSLFRVVTTEDIVVTKSNPFKEITITPTTNIVINTVK